MADNNKTCRTCRNHTDLFRLYTCYWYESLVLELIKALKFNRAKSSSTLIAQQMDELLPINDWDLVTYVPTAPRRIRIRGYDQSRSIAKDFARLRNLEFSPTLIRIDQTRQVGKKKKLRKLQASRAFRARKSLKGKHVLIVDDVMASGATMEACSKIIKESGARRVDGAVFARS